MRAYSFYYVAGGGKICYNNIDCAVWLFYTRVQTRKSHFVAFFIYFKK